MKLHPAQEGFSVPVLLELFVDGEAVEIAQVGPTSLRLRKANPAVEGKPATLVITIGSDRKTQDIVLSHALPNDPREIQYW